MKLLDEFAKVNQPAREEVNITPIEKITPAGANPPAFVTYSDFSEKEIPISVIKRCSAAELVCYYDKAGRDHESIAELVEESEEWVNQLIAEAKAEGVYEQLAIALLNK